MKIEQKGTSLLITDISEKPIKIPSQLYPVSSPFTVLTSQNTEYFDNIKNTEKIRSIFNSIEAGIGTCYTNTYKLIEELRKQGFNPVSYVGWCFVGGAMPVHHCFTLIDNHILDFFIKPSIYFQNQFEDMTMEQAREKVANLHLSLQNTPNSDKATFGKADPYVLYIAAPCTPEKGLDTYKKLIKAFPKHPCYTNIKNSTNETQLKILEKQKKNNHHN